MVCKGVFLGAKGAQIFFDPWVWEICHIFGPVGNRGSGSSKGSGLKTVLTLWIPSCHLGMAHDTYSRKVFTYINQ